jgi:hypothetical protein
VESQVDDVVPPECAPLPELEVIPDALVPVVLAPVALFPLAVPVPPDPELPLDTYGMYEGLELVHAAKLAPVPTPNIAIAATNLMRAICSRASHRQRNEPDMGSVAKPAQKLSRSRKSRQSPSDCNN